MNRRHFLRTAFAATAAGLLVPEHLLTKGRSMVSLADIATVETWTYQIGVDPASEASYTLTILRSHDGRCWTALSANDMVSLTENSIRVQRT